MSSAKILLGFLITALFAGSIMNDRHYPVSVVQINSRWNTKNSLDLSSLRNCNTQNAFYEDQPFSIQRNLPRVPAIIIYKDKDQKAMFGGNMMLEPTVSVDSIQSVIDKLYEQ